jgi:hypothetical protein
VVEVVEADIQRQRTLQEEQVEQVEVEMVEQHLDLLHQEQLILEVEVEVEQLDHQVVQELLLLKHPHRKHL